MTAAQELALVATRADREAATVAHERDPYDRRRCLPSCWRCYLEARARLYVRVSESARGMEPPR